MSEEKIEEIPEFEIEKKRKKIPKDIDFEFYLKNGRFKESYNNMTIESVKTLIYIAKEGNLKMCLNKFGNLLFKRTEKFYKKHKSYDDYEIKQDDDYHKSVRDLTSEETKKIFDWL